MKTRFILNGTIAFTFVAASTAFVRDASAQAIDWRRAALRYTSSGALDTAFNAFGTPGKVVESAPGGTGTGFFDVAMSGTSIVLGGREDSSFLVERLNDDGTPDLFFGPNLDGVVTTSFSPIGSVTAAEAEGVAVDSAGNIVAAGYAIHFDFANFAVARYLSDGSLDPNFGKNGLVVEDVRIGHHALITAVRIISGGKIVVAGYSDDGWVFVVRYTNKGKRDTTFGDGYRGTVDGSARFIPPTGMTGVVANDMAIDSSGRILVGGTGIVSGQNVFACWRFTSAGKVDTSFSGDGLSYFWPNETAQAISIAADGAKPVLVGQIGPDGAHRVGLMRMTSSGGRDTSFDGDGWKELNISTSSDEVGWEVALNGSSPIVTGFSGDRVFLARFDSSGALQGTVTRTNVVSDSTVEGASALAVDASGRFVAAGWVGPPQ